jgi:hypothetical protein
MAVNARLLPRGLLAAVRVQRFDALDTLTTLDEDFKWAYCPTNDVILRAGGT